MHARVANALSALVIAGGIGLALGAAHAAPPKPFIGKGTASWYGSEHQNMRTANGERFDMHELTAAHPWLPLGTLVRVTHLANHRSVVVRINDRGVGSNGRIIDLSAEAARELHMIREGVAPVRLEVLTGESSLHG